MDSVDATASQIGATHHVRCSAVLRRDASHDDWSIDQLAEAIVAHCGHSRLRANRLARGWTLMQMIEEMVTVTGAGQRLVPSRVSRWERGAEQPSGLYRDALCRLYHTGPVELGLDNDYGSARRSTGRLEQVGEHVVTTDPTRRVPLQRIGIDLHGSEPVGIVIQRADSLRRRMDETLSASSLSDATVAYKETVAAQYGRIYKTQPSLTFLHNILADLDDVQVITDRKLPSTQRRDLCAVTARLAGLVSMTMVNLGWYRQAREWVHTARLAADEAGEPGLRAWVATRGAVASLHLGDPQAAAASAREAEVLTRHQSSNITSMAWAILARAAATMGQVSSARAAVHHAEAAFAATEPHRDNSAYQFTIGQLYFYMSHTLTTIGETRAAWQAQDDALAAFGADERLDPTLVHLDRAHCMVNNGDIAQGMEHATATIVHLPLEFRPAIVLRRARSVAAAVPAVRRNTPAARALREVLAIDVSSPGEPPS